MTPKSIVVPFLMGIGLIMGLWAPHYAQTPVTGHIHAEQDAYFQQFPHQTEAEWDAWQKNRTIGTHNNGRA